MAATLELRRQAIAEALRAVMAEPLPGRFAPAPVPQPAPVVRSEPQVSVATPAISATMPSLRDSLVAEIDWNEVEAVELESLDEWESPSVPPLELSGAMSSTASMALFGHA